MNSVIKPPALHRGDRIGVIAPASNIRSTMLDAGCRTLQKLGYETVYLDSILEHDLYFAGSLQRRARELEQMFERDDIHAIVCARGGYGANYLLPHIDINLVRQHPKVFVGYSDITCLLTWFHDAAGIVTFHGPMVTKDFSAEHGVDPVSWLASTSGNSDWEFASHSMFGLNPLIPGKATGTLYGGCLSILVASLGTPYEARIEGKLLFLEDIGAKPYQIDRMLMQLKLSGKLKAVKGIVFGEMMECLQSPDQAYTLQEVVYRIVGDLGVPVAYGLRSGHVSRENVTLPFGIEATLAVSDDTVRLSFHEAAVVTTAEQAV